jgi:hypothetical protein
VVETPENEMDDSEMKKTKERSETEIERLHINSEILDMSRL